MKRPKRLKIETVKRKILDRQEKSIFKKLNEEKTEKTGNASISQT
jgi:hypothetical protein